MKKSLASKFSLNAPLQVTNKITINFSFAIFQWNYFQIFIVQKTDRYHFNKAIIIIITNNGTNWHDSSAIKDDYLDNWQNWNKVCRFDKSIVSMLISWKILFFRKYTCKYLPVKEYHACNLFPMVQEKKTKNI